MNRSIIRLIIISLLIMLGILFIGPLFGTIKENKVMAAAKGRFAFVSDEIYFHIYYDKKTKVMYAVSDLLKSRKEYKEALLKQQEEQKNRQEAIDVFRAMGMF